MIDPILAAVDVILIAVVAVFYPGRPKVLVGLVAWHAAGRIRRWTVPDVRNAFVSVESVVDALVDILKPPHLEQRVLIGRRSQVLLELKVLNVQPMLLDDSFLRA